VFNAAGARFASAVFTSLDDAKAWITINGLSGVLTKYPVDIGVYEWAVAGGLFTPKTEQQRSSSFIGEFTTASMDHYHFESGELG